MLTRFCGAECRIWRRGQDGRFGSEATAPDSGAVVMLAAKFGDTCLRNSAGAIRFHLHRAER